VKRIRWNLKNYHFERKNILSHIVTIETEVRDVNAIRGACSRLRLEQPAHGEHSLFARTATGWAVKLSDWRYPVVCDTESGKAHFDNYDGHWGERARLDEFLQAYACVKTKVEARRKGHSVTEQKLADGCIKLTVALGAAS
jgi:hypothetical protein